jgi:hypothetical protein
MVEISGGGQPASALHAFLLEHLAAAPASALVDRDIIDFQRFRRLNARPGLGQILLEPGIFRKGGHFPVDVSWGQSRPS